MMRETPAGGNSTVIVQSVLKDELEFVDIIIMRRNSFYVVGCSFVFTYLTVSDVLNC